jgi:hypothetical protein
MYVWMLVKMMSVVIYDECRPCMTGSIGCIHQQTMSVELIDFFIRN